MRRCVGSLDSYLIEAGFNIDSRHPISNWEETAKSLYVRQLSNPTFESEFSVYLWLTKSFFGDNAVAYQLSREGDLGDSLEVLMKVKNRFRSDISTKLDSPVNMIIDLDKVPTSQPIKTGKQGIIQIGSIPLQEGRFSGRWDYFFFKYIHTSDGVDAHEKENNILKTKGVYDSTITERQWKQMIATETLTPLNFEAYKNE